MAITFNMIFRKNKEEPLKQANIKMEDLDAICVTKGPGLVGSLHIGLQVAKTLSLACLL